MFCFAQEGRQDREIINLLDTLNVGCEINNHCDNIIATKNSTLQELNDKVSEYFDNADKILNCEKATETVRIIYNITCCVMRSRQIRTVFSPHQQICPSISKKNH